MLLIIPEADLGGGGGWGGGWYHPPPVSQCSHMVWSWNLHQTTRNTSWQKVTIDDVIILVTWLVYNLQTRSKMRNRYPISGSFATILTSNFVRYVRVTKDLQTWQHHDSHVTWIQFTDAIENEDQILYLKFYMHYWLEL